jgi:hypothetical protein
VPLGGKHGDMCVVGGFTTTTVKGRAENHDPQHIPYGIVWRKQLQHATEQLTTTPPPETQIPTAPDTTTESSATEATAATLPTIRTPRQTQPDPQVVAVLPERQMSLLPLEKDSASASPATELPDALVQNVAAQHRTDAGVVCTQADAEITHHTRSDTTTESSATEATAAAVPTGRTPQQTQPDPHVVAVPPGKQLPQLPLEIVSASTWPATEQPEELIQSVTVQHLEDVLAGPVEDENGMKHPHQEAAWWGSGSSAPVTSSATKGDSSTSKPQTKTDSLIQEMINDELTDIMGAASAIHAPKVITHLEEKLSEGKLHELTQCVAALRKLVAYSLLEVGMSDQALEALASFRKMKGYPESHGAWLEEGVKEYGTAADSAQPPEDHKPQTDVSCDADTGTTRHATEQSQPGEHEPPELTEHGQEMAYGIVNAFLDNVTFVSTEAEELIKEVILKTGAVIPPSMLHNIDEVFQPIFFYFPNGVEDRTRRKPRDPNEYIRQWREIAKWRNKADIVPAPGLTTEVLPKQQVQSIFQQYILNFIDNEADVRQRAQPFTKNKSRAEAVLRKRCGSTTMAKLIWQVGLPNISAVCYMDGWQRATEQQEPLKHDVRDAIETATETILEWLGMLADSIQDHKETPIYQEHARKSGTQKNKSGLTDEELAAKQEKKRDARLKYGRQPSTASGSDTWHAPAQWQWHDDTPAQWHWRGNTWQAPAGYWQWHDDPWQEPAHWQGHGDLWQ